MPLSHARADAYLIVADARLVKITGARPFPIDQGCSAVVALHPDEATGAIVDFCVRARKPFVIVPCCVFARLFPERRTAAGTTVATRSELIDYLVSKDCAIQTTELPFQGANIALWATFVL